jgi:hypothetical protein
VASAALGGAQPRQDGRDRVAQGATQHREHGSKRFRGPQLLACGLVAEGFGSQQHGDPREPQGEPRQAPSGQALAGDEQVGQTEDGERHDRHEDPGEPAVDPALSPGDEPKGQDIAKEGDQAKEDPGPPVGPSQTPVPCRERQEQGCGQQQAPGHYPARRHAADGHLGQEEGRAP